MKKNILLIFVFSLFLSKTNAQIPQANFQDYKRNLSVGLNSNGVIRILDFQGKKLLVFSQELALLDTSTGKFTSLFFPLDETYPNIYEAGIDSSGKLVLLFSDALFEFDGQKWETNYIGPVNGGFTKFMIDSANIVHCLLDSAYGFSDHQWNGTSWRIVPINQINQNPFIESIQECIPGPHNDCRLITSKNRILYFSGKGYLFKDSIKAPPSNTYSITFDKSGDLWYAIHDSLIKQDSLGNKTVFTSLNSPFVNGQYLPILINSSGKWLLYINQNTNELYQYKNNTWSLLTTLPNSSPSLSFQSNNEVWLYEASQIAVYGNKFLKSYNNLVYQQVNFKPKCILSVLYGSPPGDVWIGTETGIYNFYNSNYYPQTGLNFRLLDSLNTPLTNNQINALDDNANNNSFYPDADTVFIGTDDGLFIAGLTDSLSFSIHLNKSNSLLPSDTILSLKYFNGFNYPYTSELWVGTNKGIALLNLAALTFKVYDTANSVLPSNHINHIIPQNPFIFLCTDSGFVQIKDTVWKAFTKNNSSLPSPDVHSVAVEDLNPKGEILWIGTMGGGLASYNDTSGHWEFYSKTLGNFPTDSINFIYGSGYTYSEAYPYSIIGTRDTGLIIYNDNYSNDFSTNYTTQQFFYNGVEKNIMVYQQNTPGCEGGGWDFIGLTDSGFIRDFECFGGIENKKPATQKLSAWIDNPQLNILWSELATGKANVFLYDMMGRNVMNVTAYVDGNNHIITPMPALASGIYLLRVLQPGKTGSQLLPVIR